MLTTYFKQSTTSIIKVYNSLLNIQCIYCLQPSEYNICSDCMAVLPILGQHCPRCAEPNHHGQLCGHCLKYAPAFDGVVAAFEYRPPISDLIHSWKAREHTHGIEMLMQSLVDNLACQQFDFIVPVPYHWQKLLKRGHNPVRSLSKYLSKRLNNPLLDTITRIKPGIDQQGLARKKRLNNLRGVFALHEKYKTQLQHKNILLVDDVVTTGATCNHISKLLKAAGAHSITVACLARTPAKGT